jgi:hypothetical protein
VNHMNTCHVRTLMNWEKYWTNHWKTILIHVLDDHKECKKQVIEVRASSE